MTTPSYSLALPSDVHRQAAGHLLRDDRQEDLCFGLWYPSSGAVRQSALIAQLILPERGDRRVHGNASFLPQYFERAIDMAIREGAGLAFFHSHPAGAGWQDMSRDDINAEEGHAAAVKAATGLPFVGLTLAGDQSWSARFWEKTAPRTYRRHSCESVRVVGDQFAITYADYLLPIPSANEKLARTVSAWGADAQAMLARLHIGIVGAGSVGAVVAEALAKMGIIRITLVDFDGIETVNLDRLLHATKIDALLHRSKVQTLGKGISRTATASGFQVRRVEYSVAEEEGYRAALDCDVLFSCVDRPLARSVLNFIAYAHLIPVVDGGIQAEASHRGTLRRADWRADVAAPGMRCMSCTKQYDPGLVSADREGYFDDPEYIRGLKATDPMRRNENVIAFTLGCANLQLLHMLTMVLRPLGLGTPGAQMYHAVPGVLDEPETKGCETNCSYPALVAKGERTGIVVTGSHKKAVEARNARRAARPRLGWRLRAAEILESVSERAFDFLFRKE